MSKRKTKAPKPKCTICKRSPGPAPLNRFGYPDPNPDVELGPLATCQFCWTLQVCPDCLHERDCCPELEI